MDIPGNDLDVNLSRKVPKKGRRAGLLFTTQTDIDAAISTIDGSIASPGSNDVFQPPKPKNVGGWADDSTNQHKGHMGSVESDSEIPVIPDLDDLDDDILSITELDNMQTKSGAYRELDTNVLQQGVFDIVTCLDGVDLSILTRFLLEENEITETDEPWTWDSLFTEVTSSSWDQLDESGDELLS